MFKPVVFTFLFPLLSCGILQSYKILPESFQYILWLKEDYNWNQWLMLQRGPFLSFPRNFLSLDLHVNSELGSFPVFFLFHSCLEYCFPSSLLTCKLKHQKVCYECQSLGLWFAAFPIKAYRKLYSPLFFLTPTCCFRGVTFHPLPED